MEGEREISGVMGGVGKEGHDMLCRTLFTRAFCS